MHRASTAGAVLELAGTTFVVEYRRSGSAAPVSAAIEQLRMSASSVGPDAIPLVAVPFMGPVGRRRCEDAGVAWLDLSGNARIIAPGMRVVVQGQPNLFKNRGRPSTAFAAKSSRITRWLLMHAARPMKQREIAQATGMDEGFTSRIISRLEEENFILRGKDKTVQLRDPDLLLDAWHEAYDFSMHHITQGHIAARSGEETLRLLADSLHRKGTRYAMTGLAGAWLLTKYSGFRLVTTYVTELPDPEILESVGFREEARGANVWIVVPKDEGVFQGMVQQDGVICVHPVQVYLDLKSQPERAKEAAEDLRSRLLRWSSHA